MARNYNSFLASHPKFAANYNQLSGADQGRWQNKFQAGGPQAVKPFTQSRLAQQQAPKVANVGTYQPMQQQIPQAQQWQNRQQFQPMQPMPQTQMAGNYAMGTQQFNSPMQQQPVNLQAPNQTVQRGFAPFTQGDPSLNPNNFRYAAAQQQQSGMQQIQPQGWTQDPTTGQWRRA